MREAFVSALGTSLKISAALVLLGIVLAVVLLRRTEPADARRSDAADRLGHPAARAAGRRGAGLGPRLR